nr:CoA transferase [Bradyrhizobium sp. CCBAU 11430]
MNASIGILSALYHCKVNGGQGQHVAVWLLDTVIASLSRYLQTCLVNGKSPPRRGTWVMVACRSACSGALRRVDAGGR